MQEFVKRLSLAANQFVGSIYDGQMVIQEDRSTDQGDRWMAN